MSAPWLSVRSNTCTCLVRQLRRQTQEASTRSFSACTTSSYPRRTQGTNKMRGMSAIRSSGKIGAKVKSIQPWQLPVPVTDPSKRAQVETDPEHGLWGFFNEDKEALTEPRDLNAHGRAWSKKELRIKGLGDLKALWWKCHFELNRLSTEKAERVRLKPGYGMYELEERESVVEDSIKAIKDTLLERHQAWEEARSILNNGTDPDIELDDNGQMVWRQRPDEPYDFGDLEADTPETIEPVESEPSHLQPIKAS